MATVGSGGRFTSGELSVETTCGADDSDESIPSDSCMEPAECES